MTIDALYPVAGNHAIQSVAFILQWPIPLESKQLVAIKSFADPLKQWFSVVQEQKMMTFQIGPMAAGGDQTLPQTTVDDMAGLHFLQPNPSLGPAGVTRMIQLDKSNLSIVINDYSKWAETWSLVSTWLNIILPAVLDGRPISGAILQYNDAFEWRGNPAELQLKEVLRLESKYLTANVFESENLWHLHQGYIVDRTAPLVHRLIENVNINVTEPNSRRTISIFSSHHGTLAAPLWQADSIVNELALLFNDFHDRNKDILKNILTDAVCEKINLKTKAEP